jgi:hypothetical protein
MARCKIVAAVWRQFPSTIVPEKQSLCAHLIQQAAGKIVAAILYQWAPLRVN